MLRTTRPVISRPFFISLVFAWLAIVIAALVFLNQHPKDTWLLTAALPACLLESAFYLSATFADTRDLFARAFRPMGQAALLFATGLLPYVTLSTIAGTFRGDAFVLLAALTALFAFWYVLVPRRLTYDLGFLVIAAAPIVAHVFKHIYISPDAEVQLDILGHLMWIRVGVISLLVIRGWDPGAFNLWPRAREWRIGALCYVLIVLPLCGLAVVLGDVQLAPLQKSPLVIAVVAIGTFFGILWVVALSEELFFRGFIARALLNDGRSPLLAIAVSSVLFGTVHLWFHQFPNWRRALVATVLGFACGIAYTRAKSVRAPMVTHALVVTTWRLFFR